MRRCLYFGLRLPEELSFATHFPLIEIEPLPVNTIKHHASHLLFTSQTAIELYEKRATSFEKSLPCMVVGKKSAKKASNFNVQWIAKDERQEGIIELLKSIRVEKLLWPRSKQARGNISQFCKQEGIALEELILYSITTTKAHPPALENFDEIFFTSPSTVKAFIELYGTIPQRLKVHTIGPVTDRAYKQV